MSYKMQIKSDNQNIQYFKAFNNIKSIVIKDQKEEVKHES